jgi:hypothetical protein
MRILIAISLALASAIFFQEANASTTLGCGNNITQVSAKTCVDDMISTKLDSVYNFVTSHNNGKHLADLANCTATSFKDGSGKGSYFPSDQTEFNKVFAGANVACTAPSNNRIYCTFTSPEDLCFLNSNEISKGVYPKGVKGHHTVQFALSVDDGQLRTLFPIQ